MKKITEILRKKQGTTMVEMMVTLLLISIMMTMAVSSLSSASHIFMQVQKTQYAQSILDTVMTELRAITKNASSYIKIYENAKNIANSTGNCDGNTIEFINEEGYAVLVSTDGCDDTELFCSDASAGSYYTGGIWRRRYQTDGSVRILSGDRPGGLCHVFWPSDRRRIRGGDAAGKEAGEKRSLCIWPVPGIWPGTGSIFRRSDRELVFEPFILVGEDSRFYKWRATKCRMHSDSVG